MGWSIGSEKKFLTAGLIIVTLYLAFYILARPSSRNSDHHPDLRTLLLTGTPPKPRQLPNHMEPLTREELINRLKSHHLTPPVALEEPYNLSVAYPSYAEHDQYHKKLLDILRTHHRIDTGFFVEAGALDGQYLSHSLELEMKHGWNGLLVEASPSLTGQLRSKKRKCWSADVCLTGAPYMKIDYITKTNQTIITKRGNGKISPKKSGIKPRNFDNPQDYRSEGEVECFALYSLLTALKVKVVDLLVLDIEGHEFQVLSTYPYDLIPIKVIAVEHYLLPMPSSVLKKFVLGKGYKLVYESSSDYVFVLKN